MKPKIYEKTTFEKNKSKRERMETKGKDEFEQGRELLPHIKELFKVGWAEDLNGEIKERYQKKYNAFFVTLNNKYSVQITKAFAEKINRANMGDIRQGQAKIGTRFKRIRVQISTRYM